MKKIINTAEKFIPEMLEGIYAAHPGEVTYVDGDLHCLVNARKHPGKVGLATGGGSGHLPLFLGYVGEGMLDGCSIGDVFQSPTADQMLSVTREIDQGAGVLYIYGNYNGDIFCFDTTAKMALNEEGIRVESVVGGEDVASAPAAEPGKPNKRRGVAGIFFVFKCAGAAAAAMKDLDEVKRVAEKAAANVRTMGVALTPCIVPMLGHASFSIGENEMEIGMGIHGERGIRRGELRPADEIVDEMLTPILGDLPYQAGDEVAVLVNGLGGTPLEEQYVMFRRIKETLDAKGISVFHTYVGEYATSMEMAGASISLLKVDDELKEYLSAPVDTPFFKQHQLTPVVNVAPHASPRKAAAGADAEAAATVDNGAFKANDMRAYIAAIADIMNANAEWLIELDGVAGDSDLGLTMSKGFSAAARAATEEKSDDIGTICYVAGKALHNAASSSMGTLMSNGLMSAGLALKGYSGIDGKQEASFFKAYFDGVQKLGKAEIGDKTFLDGMADAAALLVAEADAAGVTAELAAKAAATAEASFQNTRTMLAKHGRMAMRGEGSREMLDPGAAVAMLIVKAYAGFKA